jgi:deazaflavin-dependent oxidoreductase (nitroreductase family)
MVYGQVSEGKMDITKFTPQQMNTLRKIFHQMNHFMVFGWKLGLGKAINIWPAGFGRIMVIKHCGRKSGKEYLTPVNYAIVEKEIYCTAGFGSISDWYRNILVNPSVELWLPDGKRTCCAEEISSVPNRLFLLRQVIIASGFAARLFGINPNKLNDEQLDAVSKDYRLVHFREDK